MTTLAEPAVSLNSDVGEGYGNWVVAGEDEVLRRSEEHTSELQSH